MFEVCVPLFHPALTVIACSAHFTLKLRKLLPTACRLPRARPLRAMVLCPTWSAALRPSADPGYPGPGRHGDGEGEEEAKASYTGMCVGKAPVNPLPVGSATSPGSNPNPS